MTEKNDNQPGEPGDQDIMAASALSKPTGSTMKRGAKQDQLAAMLDRFPHERALFDAQPDVYRDWLKAANHLAVQRVIIANARIALHSSRVGARALAQQTLDLYDGERHVTLVTAAAAMRRSLMEMGDQIEDAPPYEEKKAAPRL